MRSSVSALVLLAACGGAPDIPVGAASRPAIRPAVAPAIATAYPAAVRPRPVSPTALPLEPRVATYEQVGKASWYGEELRGNRTANGERFDPAGITAAHRTLPLGSFAEVTALDTGRTIIVRINDRGPHRRDREIDLSRGAADLVAPSRSVFAVRVRGLAPGTVAAATPRPRGEGVTTSTDAVMATREY